MSKANLLPFHEHLTKRNGKRRKKRIECDDIVRETSMTCVTAMVFAVDMDRYFRSFFTYILLTPYTASLPKSSYMLCTISILISSANTMSCRDNH